MIDDLIMLRSAERILALIIGGLAIWCGFRLFLAVPDQPADARAELSLAKNQRLLISRIGPGVFFALFGTAVVLASFYFSINLQTSEGDRYSGIGQRPPTLTRFTVDSQAKPVFDGAEMRLTLAFLIETEAELAGTGTGTEAERNWRARRFQAARLAIIERGWESDWGEIAEFELWLNQGSTRSTRPEFERALAVMEGRE